MRLQKIEIREFRQYRNQCYSFDKVEGKTDLHIIHGRNGVGKTNLLNAISWCLYGKELHLRNEETAVEPINSQLVTELRKRGGGQAEMFVSMEFREDTTFVIFKRFAEFVISDVSVDETSGKFEISTNDNENHSWQKIVEDEEVKELVQKYIPQVLNPYIFFDGEQMETFFSPEHIKDIEMGIYNWTQASYLTDAYKAFKKYIKDEIEPNITAMGDNNINKLQQERDLAESNLDASHARLAEYQQQIEKCTNEIKMATTIIGGHENLKTNVDRLSEIDKKLEILDSDKVELMDDMMKFARNQYYAHAIYPSLKCYYDYIKRQDELGNLPPRIDKAWLRSMLANHKCAICGRDTDAKAEHIIKELEYSLCVASATSAELNKALGSLTEFFKSFDSYEKDRDILKQRSIKIEKEKKELEQERIKLERFLHSIPDNQKISDAIERRDQFQDIKNDYIAKEAVEQVQYQGLENKFNEIKEKYDKALSLNYKYKELDEKKQLCESCQRILSKIKYEILAECRKSIQEETYKNFDKLIWKKGSFSGVKITDDYQFKLLDKYGNQTLGSCSAAEGALLALSFTLALQDVAGLNSLLFIDTPLGRVDDENRENFIDTLLKIAKDKQVILTFTPTEYSDNVKIAIAGKYSSFTKIQMDNDGITTSR